MMLRSKNCTASAVLNDTREGPRETYQMPLIDIENIIVLREETIYNTEFRVTAY